MQHKDQFWKPDKWTRKLLRSGDKKIKEIQEKILDEKETKPLQKSKK